jgi:transcriptional regulator EpsA
VGFRLEEAPARELRRGVESEVRFSAGRGEGAMSIHDVLGEAQSARFLRVVCDSLLIKRHYELYVWLRGDLQEFLPHEIVICVWGDFERWNLKFDLISAIPGVRTTELANCGIDDIVRESYARWRDAGRKPLFLHADDAHAECGCAIHDAIRSMRTALVHGVRDERAGCDSLYITLSRDAPRKGNGRVRFDPLLESLVAHIDLACRRVAALPIGSQLAERAVAPLELSSRERQILERMCRGSTNVDIAAALEISPFTVKNHVQRIFRKIGVSNRTQAAAKYHQLRARPSAA